jgi:ribonuclease E
VKQHYLTFLMSFISLSLIFSAAPVTAQSIYRWTDAQGRVHFSNAPVSEATAVDDELPPATSFGGVQDSSPSPPQTPTSAEQQPDAQRSTAALSPDQEEAENGAEPANNEEPTAPEREPVATSEEAAGPESEEPVGEDSDVESLPQASVDFSEREEPGTQTAASENQRPSLLDEEEDQPAPETRDAEEENEEEDEDESEDSEDTDDNGDENEPEAVEEDS